jgi:hypothetical protein
VVQMYPPNVHIRSSHRENQLSLTPHPPEQNHSELDLNYYHARAEDVKGRHLPMPSAWLKLGKFLKQSNGVACQAEKTEEKKPRRLIDELKGIQWRVGPPAGGAGVSGAWMTRFSKSQRAARFEVVTTMRARTIDFISIRASLNSAANSGLTCVNVSVATRLKRSPRPSTRRALFAVRLGWTFGASALPCDDA